MLRLAWGVGAGLMAAAGVLGIASEARATCSSECEMVPVYADCSEAPLLDESAPDSGYAWEELDELRLRASCTQVCCAPVEDGCGAAEPVSPAVVGFRVRGDVEGDFDVELSYESACDGDIVIIPIDMVEGQGYTVSVDGLTSVRVEAAAEDEDAAGCRIGGSSGALGLSGLVLLGLVVGRRRAPA